MIYAHKYDGCISRRNSKRKLCCETIGCRRSWPLSYPVLLLLVHLLLLIHLLLGRGHLLSLTQSVANTLSTVQDTAEGEVGQRKMQQVAWRHDTNIPTIKTRAGTQ